MTSMRKWKIQNTGEKEKVMVHYDKLFRGDSSPRESRMEVEDISYRTKKQQMPYYWTTDKYKEV